MSDIGKQQQDRTRLVNQLGKRTAKLESRRDLLKSRLESVQGKLKETVHIETIAGQVSEALEALSGQLFRRLLDTISSSLSSALQDIFDQPIELKAVVDWKRGSNAIDFHVERNGMPEDIMKGQGGSVANVLSIGLRIFALSTLDPARNRRVLILDEQDCWLRTDLVSKLVNVIKQTSEKLGFQIIMISHHDVEAFEKAADRIYHLQSNGDTVDVSIRERTDD